MSSRKQILNQLVNSVSHRDSSDSTLSNPRISDLILQASKHNGSNGHNPSNESSVEELSLGQVAKGAAIALGVKALLGRQSFKASKGNRPSAANTYAKQLTAAKNPQQQVAAAVGLLSVAGQVLSKIPDLRDLGFKIMQVVNSERLEDFLEPE